MEEFRKYRELRNEICFSLIKEIKGKSDYREALKSNYMCVRDFICL